MEPTRLVPMPVREVPAVAVAEVGNRPCVVDCGVARPGERQVDRLGGEAGEQTVEPPLRGERVEDIMGLREVVWADSTPKQGRKARG